MFSFTKRSQTSVVSGRPPFLLRWRCSSPFITFTVALGVLVDLAGYGLIVPVVPYRLESLGYSGVSSKAGWLVAGYAGGIVIASPLMGYIGGLTKARRTPLLLCLIFLAAAIVLFMETTVFSVLMVSRVLQGVAGSGVWTFGLALITDSIPEERVGVAMGTVIIAFSCGQLIGPPVGGSLYNKLGYRSVFIFALILIAADCLLRLLVIEKRDALPWIEAGLVDIPNFEMPGYIRKELRDSKEAIAAAEQEAIALEAAHKINELQALKMMLVSPRAWTLLALDVINGIVLGGMLDTGMVLYVERHYGLSSIGAGLVFIALVIPSFIISPFSGWCADKGYARLTASLGVALSLAAIPLLYIRGPLPLFIFFLVLNGVSMSLYLPPVLQDLSDVVKTIPGLPSTYAFGAFMAAFSIGSFIGPIIAGQLFDGLGTQKGWLVMLCVCVAISVAVLPFVIAYTGAQEPLWKRKNGGKVVVEEKEGVQA